MQLSDNLVGRQISRVLVILNRGFGRPCGVEDSGVVTVTSVVVVLTVCQKEEPKLWAGLQVGVVLICRTR